MEISERFIVLEMKTGRPVAVVRAEDLPGLLELFRTFGTTADRELQLEFESMSAASQDWVA